MCSLGLSSTVCKGKSCAVLLPSRTVVIKLQTISSDVKVGTRFQRKNNSAHIFSNLQSCAPQGVDLSVCVGVTDWIGKEQIVDRGEQMRQ